MAQCNLRTPNWTKHTPGTDGSVLGAVNRKTHKYSNTYHCVKPVWASIWWSSSTLGQIHLKKLTFCKGFQWNYATINAGNFRLTWDEWTRYCYGNSDARIKKCNETWNIRVGSLQNEMLERLFGCDNHGQLMVNSYVEACS